MTARDYFHGDETLVPSALRVYRCWNIEFDGDGRPAMLTSTGVDFDWETKNVTATCLGGGEHHAWGSPAPLGVCHCGVYGWYHPNDARLVVRPVFGLIEVTGHVILGTNGVRAEHAQLVAMSPYNMTEMNVLFVRALRDLVEKRYPGVHVFTRREDLAAEYGVADLRAFGITATPVPDEDGEPVMPVIVSLHTGGSFALPASAVAVSGVAGVARGGVIRTQGLWGIYRIPIATRKDQLMTLLWLVLFAAMTGAGFAGASRGDGGAVIIATMIIVVNFRYVRNRWVRIRGWLKVLRTITRYAVMLGIAGLCIGVALTFFSALH